MLRDCALVDYLNVTAICLIVYALHAAQCYAIAPYMTVLCEHGGGPRGELTLG